MGWKASDTRPLSFEDCVVPEENMLGCPGDGFKQFMQILRLRAHRYCCPFGWSGQACLDEALSYAQQRKQFGMPISSFQAIQFKLADMDMEIELARLMYYKAAWLHMQGLPYSREASMAKLYASEVAKRAADQAVQIYGGYGFMDEYPVSRYWRRVKINEIGEGTSEIYVWSLPNISCNIAPEWRGGAVLRREQGNGSVLYPVRSRSLVL